MKFVKGMVMGTLLSTGAIMMYTEGSEIMNKNKMMKKGKRIAKKMGIM